jgi:hypothetical protein
MSRSERVNRQLALEIVNEPRLNKIIKVFIKVNVKRHLAALACNAFARNGTFFWDVMQWHSLDMYHLYKELPGSTGLQPRSRMEPSYLP